MLSRSSRSLVRFFATETAASSTKSTKLLLNFALPYQTLFEEKEVERVDVPATSGDMGVLANHVATIQQLKPGVIDVLMEGGKSKKFFVSGGFAVMTPDNQLNINAVEAATIDQIDKNYVKQFMATGQKNMEKATSESEKALYAAEIEVYQAMDKVVV